ncbi:DUF362 domain-containing protein [Opitutia bacterium ISCC 51]|nr:DUF362 domain-containing protein [Opitutae bacterium ISCC 51]QXD27981.1 DUF362 domain-containing protein [Opitutae bacterium ISCC 52]
MSCKYSRRKFLGLGAGAMALTPCMMNKAYGQLSRPLQNIITGQSNAGHLKNANVGIVQCLNYGPEVHPAMKKMFDLIGGITQLVKNKTVTVKINMTTADWTNKFGGRHPGETFMTHADTALALAHLLTDAGATRVRFTESSPLREDLDSILSRGGWDIRAFKAAGKKIGFENTRNLGEYKSYSQFKVAGDGYMFNSFELNKAYDETDVVISLCKLKDHITAGVTLSMKNMFGITPNTLYGREAGSERAIGHREPLHRLTNYDHLELPGIKPEQRKYGDPGYSVPHIITDICAARPIHLSIIDGITSVSGGEIPDTEKNGRPAVSFTAPAVMIAGFNPVSVDAVGMAVMGYDDPHAKRGEWPFKKCDNHIHLAEQAGLGIADLNQIDVRGMTIDEAFFPY